MPKLLLQNRDELYYWCHKHNSLQHVRLPWLKDVVWSGLGKLKNHLSCQLSSFLGFCTVFSFDESAFLISACGLLRCALCSSSFVASLGFASSTRCNKASSNKSSSVI